MEDNKIPNVKKMLRDNILVKREPTQETTPGGIIVPKSNLRAANVGEIVALGPGEFDTTTGGYRHHELSIGDKILFGHYSGTEVSFEEKEGEFLTMQYKDITAILD